MIILLAIFGVSLAGLIGLVAVLARRRADRRPAPPAKAFIRKTFGPDARPVRTAEPAGRRQAILAASAAPQEELPRPPAALRTLPSAPSHFSVLHVAAQQAIVFRQDFPPNQSRRGKDQHAGFHHRSWFGGIPSADAEFVWPRGNTHGRPLHFIAQVVLGDIPASARLDLLPDHGLLWLFLDLSEGVGDDFRVIWQPQEGSGSTAELALPPDLAPAYGLEGSAVWPWTLPAEAGASLLPCWPMSPVAITVPQPNQTDPALEPNAELLWPGSAIVGPALLAAQGPLVRYDPITEADFADQMPPWSGFPRDWLSVQIVAALIVREVDHAARAFPPTLWPDEPEEARQDAFARIRDEAIAWHEHALRNAAFEPLEPEVRNVFTGWFAELDEIALAVAPDAFTAAIETGLHAYPESAHDVPAAILDRLAARHALAASTPTDVIAPLPTRMLAPPSGDGGALPPLGQSHLLLFELVDNAALGHHFDGRILQFWITPEDLGAGRFDEVVLTKVPA